MSRPVVITAMGVISSLGSRPASIAKAVGNEQVAFRYSEANPRVAVAPIQSFDVRRFIGRFKNLRYLNRGACLAAAAAVDAARQAGLTAEQWASAGLFCGMGPNLDMGGECPDIQAGVIGETRLSALWILRFLPNTAASAIAQLTGIRGENLTVGTACAASLQAVGEAYRRIKDGYLDVALAGGGDSRLSAGALLAYSKAGALYRGMDSPGTVSRPFDQHRSGFVPGEGGAFFVLEAADHALGRGAPVLAQVCGYGATLDGAAMTAPRPDGLWAEKAVHGALADAGLTPNQIDMVSSHGTGTPLNDEVEAQMLQRVFGSRRPLVMALKSWIGHLAAACGAVELALCLSALQTGVWPYIRNLQTPCQSRLCYLQRGREVVSGNILMENFGFGGQNAALVIRPWQS